jgi:hypothetical protein
MLSGVEVQSRCLFFSELIPAVHYIFSGELRRQRMPFPSGLWHLSARAQSREFESLFFKALCTFALLLRLFASLVCEQNIKQTTPHAQRVTNKPQKRSRNFWKKVR